MPLPYSDAASASEGAEPPLDVPALESALDRILEPVLSARRRPAALARALARLRRAEQDFVLRWAAVLARSSPELAFQFVAAAPGVLARAERATAEAWLLRAMDAYDRDGLQRASEALHEPVGYGAAFEPHAVELADVAPVLQLFVHALAGRRLRIESGARCYTDTETIYLPQRIATGATAEENFLLYKATVALLWAQSRHGTFNVDLAAACARFPDSARALELLNALETVRLEARIARALPGLARDIARREHAPVDARCSRLLERDASIADTLEVLAQVYDAPPVLPRFYPSVLEPQHAGRVRAQRLERERRALQSALAGLPPSSPEANDGESIAFTIENANGREVGGETGYVLVRDGEATALPPGVAGLVDSIVQDLGTVPDDYLVTAASAPGPEIAADALERPADIRKAFLYDEWDCYRGHYRKSWCTVRENEVAAGDPAFIEQTLARYGGRIRSLRRTFELMRDEEKLLRKQSDGDGIDFDALVEAYADAKAGSEVTPLLFTRRHKIERDLAVVFLVDMSGSTKGWINDAEREALVMLCEALEALGDRYAIYGFSGLTRRRCEIYRVKRFDERYDELVRGRIAGIEPQDYTRMGAAIRHVSTLLKKIEAGTRLLVTLSDGKPDDYSDEYRGEYGIEDTRKALLEAHQGGIHAYGITIDHEARGYLPHMYGPVNWTFVDDVALLPARVADIYRRITS